MITKNNMTYVSAADIQDVFRILFRVWKGTNAAEMSAEDILEDAARTIGHRAFGIQAEGGALNRFVGHCRNERQAILDADRLAGTTGPWETRDWADRERERTGLTTAERLAANGMGGR